MYSVDGAAVAVMWLARSYEAFGDYDEALAVIRRRPRFFYMWAEYSPGFFKEEGRLAALAGDTVGAIDAYQKYLNLRTDPHPGSMQEQVDEVRHALAELVGEPSGGN